MVAPSNLLWQRGDPPIDPDDRKTWKLCRSYDFDFEKRDCLVYGLGLGHYLNMEIRTSGISTADDHKRYPHNFSRKRNFKAGL